MLDFDLDKTSCIRRYGVRASVGLDKSKCGTQYLVFLCNEGNGECNVQAVATVVARCNIHVDAGVS